VLLAREARGIATLKSVRASSMIDSETIAMVRGSGMQAAHPAIEVTKSARWFMAGPPVAIGATRILVEEIQRVQDDGVKIDWLIPHQANLTRILLPACAKTGIDPDRLCASFAETGNTSSASIPILLDQLIESRRARPGEHALMVGFGASFSIGSALRLTSLGRAAGGAHRGLATSPGAIRPHPSALGSPAALGLGFVRSG
jgi:3-oxoacyl-[acyl-carrier-protein] synthase III